MTNFALPFEVSPYSPTCTHPWFPAHVKEIWREDGKTRYWCEYLSYSGLPVSEVLTEDSPFCRNKDE